MSEGERRLAAIMFTDMVGYTALSQSNESLALRLLSTHRDLIRPSLAQHRGKEIKTIGDAFLIEFESALDAVNCAVDFQKTIREYNAGAKDKVLIRVGIHLGDVVHQQGDVYGDAVNIASRIEPLAQGGGICITEQTYDQVRNKVPYKMVKLGTRQLKNVSVPIEVYKVELPWEGAASRRMETGPLPADRIAVLPFVNISPNPDDEYFADGMTEELITSLSLVKGLKVIARTSVMNYKKKEMNVSEIGRELGVGTIVEGSIRKAAERIRVTVQVIDVNSEEHLWASNYDAKLDDVFAVQSDIAGKVAGSLPGAIAPKPQELPKMKDTEDLTAYMNYLQGRELVFDKLEAPLRQSLQFFGHAAERDPKFARAYVGMAQSYVSLGLGGFIAWKESLDTARAYLDKAMSLNENLSEAHTVRATLAFMADEPFEVMEGEARKAIELNQNDAVAYQALAEISATQGKSKEWVRLLETAYQLDPLSSLIIERLSRAYIYNGRDADALSLLQRTMHLEPMNTHRWMWTYYVSKRNYEDAAKEVAQLEALEPTWEFTLFSKGFLAGLMGDRKTAEEVIASLDKTHMMGWAKSSLAGLIYFSFGEMDAFFERMAESAKGHTLRATDLMYSPLFAKARSDPRLPGIMAMTGISWKPEQLPQ